MNHEPANKPVPLAGSTSHRDTVTEWDVPEWSDGDRFRCRLGLHLTTRKLVVDGWVGFDQVQHLYCACGTRRWIIYNGQTVECRTVEPGAMLAWIADHIETERIIANLDRQLAIVVAEATARRAAAAGSKP